MDDPAIVGTEQQVISLEIDVEPLEAFEALGLPTRSDAILDHPVVWRGIGVPPATELSEEKVPI